jgi:uncharacterized membrane protein YfcA
LARGFSGFGAGLIFMPLASSALGPAVAAPLLLVIDGVMALPLVWKAWGRFDRRDVALMTGGSLVGVPLGSWVLARADPLAMRWGIVVLIAGLLALLASGWRYRGRPAALAPTPTVSGAVEPARVRANLILFFAAASLVTVFTYAAGGLLTARVLALSLAAGPLYGLGLLAGSRLFGLASEATFRRACYALIAAAAVISMPAWDGWLGR